MTYEGQPEYVRVGFLVDLMEPWVGVANDEGSEWGDMVDAAHHLARACLSVSDEARANTVIRWVIGDFTAFFENDWWGMDRLSTSVKRARLDFDRIIQHWIDRAPAFKGEAALVEEIEALPDWVRPTEADVLTVEDDPRYEEYLRLKKRFEPGDPS